MDTSSHRGWMPALNLLYRGYSISRYWSRSFHNMSRTIPVHWPLQRGPPLQGIRDQQIALKSNQELKWRDDDTLTGTVHPYIFPGLVVISGERMFYNKCSYHYQFSYSTQS